LQTSGPEAKTAEKAACYTRPFNRPRVCPITRAAVGKKASPQRRGQRQNPDRSI